MDLKYFPLIVSVLGVFAVGNAALADRAPTQEERATIEAALKKEGFTRWEKSSWMMAIGKSMTR